MEDEYVLEFTVGDGYSYSGRDFMVFNFEGTKEEAFEHIKVQFDKFRAIRETNAARLDQLRDDYVKRKIEGEVYLKAVDTIAKHRCTIGQWPMLVDDLFDRYEEERKEYTKGGYAGTLKVSDIFVLYTREEFFNMLSNRRFVG